MQSYAQGDALAFEILYTRHKGGLYRYLLRHCGSQGIAEELFQDIWMNLIRTRERYAVKAKFTTFLYRIAHNRLIDHYRRQRPQISLDDDPAPALTEALIANPQDEPVNQAQTEQLALQLKQAITTLPAAQRDVFLLREEAGLTLEQIAAVTGVELEAVKSRFRYAIQKLRKQLSTLR